ncbi:hypothetical protein HUJ05_007791 [Dendroctonus ponderosae]|nr:hypothetical protein HUJ05_007791 [Dendroctonus ponderosae]
MCSSITTQHIADLQLVSALSIAVDEFTSHSCPKELLGLLPLKYQTRGEYIANAVIECIGKHHIPLDKIVSISTDGPKSMTDLIEVGTFLKMYLQSNFIGSAFTHFKKE